MISSEFASHASLGVAPRRDAVPAEDHSDRLGMHSLDCGDIDAELKAGPPPRDPRDAVAEALLRERFAVGGGGERDAGVGMQVIDMRGVDQAVHRGVDRGRRAATAVQAVVERVDHLVLTGDARVDVDERAKPVEPQHGKTRRRHRAEIASRALDPKQIDGPAGDRIGALALRRGVASGVVRVPGIGAETVRARDEVVDGGRRVCGHRHLLAVMPPSPLALRPFAPRRSCRSTRTGDRRPPDRGQARLRRGSRRASAARQLRRRP